MSIVKIPEHQLDLTNTTARIDTAQNDLADLGDQVSNIESKIPAEASDQNQLADKAFVNEEVGKINFVKWVTVLPDTGETKYLYAIAREEQDLEGHYIATLYVWDGSAWRGAGGYSLNINPADFALKTDLDDLGDQVNEIAANAGPKYTAGANITISGNTISAQVPEGVFTRENLIGGAGVEIIPEPVESAFDEHTLAYFHFENNFDNEIANSQVRVENAAGSFTQDYKKFGQYSLAGGLRITLTRSANINDFTADAWVLLNNNYAWHPIQIGVVSITPSNGGWDVSGAGINERYVPEQYLNAWLHIAVVRKDMVYYVFFNGKLTAVSEVSSTTNNTLFSWQADSFYYALDELRISDVARWTADFTPPADAYPYEPTGRYVVNVKPGEGLEVDENGKLKVSGGSGDGRSVGQVFFSQSSLASDNPGALPLFTGETIASANTIYPEFYNWVLSHTELQCTSEEYESALSTYGECPKYVIGDGSIRLPKLSNYIKAANTAEGITQGEAGLPNITGQTGVNTTGGVGAFSNTTESIKGTVGISGSTTSNITSYFDASRSSAVYGNSDTVTPAHTTLYPWVCAYNAALPASTAAAAEFQNALSGKLDLPSGKTQADVDFVVESYHGEDGNWYRKYKSGWVEQGGYGKGNITFLKPYSSLPNVITGSANKTGDGWPARANEVTATGFYLYGGNKDTVSAYWEAKGQGAN